MSTATTPERLSAPSPLLRFPDTSESPRRIGRQPTASGTVSRWAISSRREPGIVPGSLTIRLPVSPPAGDFLCAVSVVMAAAGMPAARSRRRRSAAMAASWQLGPGIRIKAVTKSRARWWSTLDHNISVGGVFGRRAAGMIVRLFFLVWSSQRG